MRVTKIIREYVENEINAKFDKKIAEAGKEYKDARAKFLGELRKLEEKTHIEACDLAKSLGFEYVGPADSRGAVRISDWQFDNDEMRLAERDACVTLRMQRDAAINDILLGLELGETTKSELKSVIDAINI